MVQPFFKLVGGRSKWSSILSGPGINPMLFFASLFLGKSPAGKMEMVEVDEDLTCVGSIR